MLNSLDALQQVAGQTHLLALNSAIETSCAADAGEESGAVVQR